MTILNARRRPFRGGFSLVELMVVIAIIAALLAMVVTSMSGTHAAARTTSELGALRGVLRGYSASAVDAGGILMRGYDGDQSLIVPGPDGEGIPWPASGRYVWRLLPYLDDMLGSLYVNDQQPLLDRLVGSDCHAYVASLFPSFGLNSEWLGGDTRTTASPLLAPYKFFAARLSDVRHPSRQLVFASARAPLNATGNIGDCLAGGGGSPVMDGYFEISSPHFTSSGDTWRWAGTSDDPVFSPGSDSADHGFLSTRHRGSVATGQLDGSTSIETLEELADMRRWASRATSASWVPSLDP